MDEYNFLERQFRTEKTGGAPETRFGVPVWCHHHGSKMRVEKIDLEKGTLVIAGSAAEVIIQKVSIHPDTKGWNVDWEVVQWKPNNEGARGRAFFTDKDLAAAFDLSSESGKFGQWLIGRYGADSAEQGKYIRFKGFLNIPCPGTGHDGDPNVSIHLDEEIKDAVRQLLE